MAGYIGNKAVNLSTSGADISGTANLDIVDIDGAVNMATTALVTGVLTANGGAVFNESSADVDFRVESNGNANMLFVDGGANAVGIGTGSPLRQLSLQNSSSAEISLVSGTSSNCSILMGDGTTGSDFYRGYIQYQNSNDSMLFATSAGTKMTIDSTGAVTMPAQPAFLAQPASTQENIPINSTTTVAFGTERFDQGADFSANVFSAPVTGRYQLNVLLRLDNWDTAATYYQAYINTSNRVYYITIAAPLSGGGTDLNYFTMSASVLADMDASDDAWISIFQSGGTAQTDIHAESFFSGYLVA